MKKRFLSLASVVLILCLLTGCGGKISNKALQKMLKADDDFTHIDFSSAKAVTEAEIGESSKALLFSAKGVDDPKITYHIAIADTKEDKISPVEIGYEPLELLQREIFTNRPQSINMAYFAKMSAYLIEDEKYFDDEENALEYLREITGDDGIISTTTAQDAITNMAKSELTDETAEDFWVVFEEENANPLCYAVKDVESVYSWDWLPESQYLTYVSSSSKDEIKEAEAEHGPAYDDKSVWIAYGIDGEKAGVYRTKAELFEAITGKQGDFDEEIEEETEGVLKFATVTDKAPFVYISDGALIGADIDIAKAIAEEMNMEIEISTMSSSAAVSGTGKGTYHMAMAAYTTSTDGDSIRFTDNYYGDYVIVLGQNGGKINDKICGALATLKADGTIDRIISKHNADKPVEKPAEQVSAEETPAEEKPDSTISYRVRKSADDYKSQVGAFASLENAKKEAHNYKEQGYKVYDMNGKLVYTP